MVTCRRSLIAGVAALTLLAACSGRGNEPPRPTRALQPTIVDLVTDVDTASTPFVVSLASGQRITMSSLGGSAAVSSRGNLERGFLWLSDAVAEPAWYAWAPPNGTIWPGQRKLDPECWELKGGAFDQGDAVHFSNGLRLPKAVDFRIAQANIKDPWPARSDDVFCVTRQGEVSSLAFIFTPY
jgi:hypothetical protein